MKVEQPLSEFAEKQNEELQKLIILDQDKTQLLGQILWCRAVQIILEDSLCHPDVKMNISQRQWTADTRQLYLLITRSASFYRDLQLFFETQDLSHVQTTIGAELMITVYKKVVGAAADHIKDKEACEPVEFNVKEMAVEGLAKYDTWEAGL